jgi:hypothetical protein
VVELDEETMDMLEDVIDHYGVSEILSAISYICGEKAMLSSTDWQNTTLGKHWMRVSASVDQAAAKIEKSDPQRVDLRYLH